MTMPARPGLLVTVRDTTGAETTIRLRDGVDQHVVGRIDSQVPSVVDLPVTDRHVSRRHCAITWDGDRGIWTLADLKSANGTTLDGDPVDLASAPLHDGARIKIGATLLVVRFVAAAFADAMPADEHTLVQAPADMALAGDPTILDVPPASDERTTLLAREAPVAEAPVAEAPAIEAPAIEEEGATVTTVPTGAGMSEPEPAMSRAAADARAADADADADAGMDEAAGAEEAVERRAWTRPDDDVVLGGIARHLIDCNLLDGPKAVALCKMAHGQGQTFFRALAGDSSIRFQAEIYERVAGLLGLPQVATEKDLMARARPTDWLPFELASTRGAVALAPPQRADGEDDEDAGDAENESGSGADAFHYATIDPYDVLLDDWIARCAGQPTRKWLVTPDLFTAALLRLKNQSGDRDGAANVLVIDVSADDELRLSANTDNTDIPLLVNYFLQRAFLQGASDIHIEPTEEYLLVRYRVDGMLHHDASRPMTMYPEIVSRIKIISGMDVAEKRRPQDGRIGSVIQGNAIDVRVSSYPTIYGEKVVMRLLDKNALRPSPEHLGMLARDLRLLYDKLNAPFGLVMISGPTGSGKTTTLYSCLSSIDKKTKNVLTVEDPVEYRLNGVHQMQVNDRIGLTFASGLRTILRQDPDVIMVGECRDTETAAMAIQASLTGHIVFSTIHTNDAIGVVTRMIDMGIDPFLVANALTLCIAQRLVRRVCNHCKVTITGNEVRRRLDGEGVTAERLALLDIDIDDDLTYVVGSGCMHCRNTGYQGRQAVFEVFEMTNAARTLILSPGFNADTLRTMARNAGMTTLIGHGMRLIEEGITTHAEAIRVLGEAY